MRCTITARTLIGDYERRKIAPDESHEVKQGTLKLWLTCNLFAALLYLPDQRTSIRSEFLYINTYSPQEIADDVMDALENDPSVFFSGF